MDGRVVQEEVVAEMSTRGSGLKHAHTQRHRKCRHGGHSDANRGLAGHILTQFLSGPYRGYLRTK